MSRLVRGDWRLGGALLLLIAAAGARGADDPGSRALQQDQLLRQQNQDQLQLRMQQYHGTAGNPSLDAQQRQAIQQLQLDQALRQQQLQLQQQRELRARTDVPGEDEGARRAKAQIENDRARQAGQRQLQQLDQELQGRVEAEKRRAEADRKLSTPLAGSRGTGLLPPGLPPSILQPR